MNYILFDLEATCWDTFPEKSHNFSEVIEIGAVMLDEELNEISRFDEFVKPTIHPILSPFCNTLTSITQEQVENSRTFALVLADFHDWVGCGEWDGVPLNSLCLLSWGEYDKNQLKKEMNRKTQEVESVPDWHWQSFINILDKRHISLKHRYMEKFNIKKGAGVKSTLKRLGMEFEGTHHRGIDDAINIARIFRTIRKEVGL